MTTNPKGHIFVFIYNKNKFSFRFLYNESSHLIVQNIGSCVIVKYADDGSENLILSFLSGEQYHLEYITFHWGTGD